MRERESNLLPVGRPKKKDVRVREREEEEEERTMQREASRDHLKGMDVLFLHAAGSVVGYSPTG